MLPLCRHTHNVATPATSFRYAAALDYERDAFRRFSRRLRHYARAIFASYATLR